ncbi:MAG: hypothetical protein P9L92_19020 [Candidatus Electryonea clarkiae]|nr:hypothetical protein [Candidatus Electryonea clarkiae]MDP8285150.1 hypothetical protein [Candidatus Electryonea clarkiae]
MLPGCSPEPEAIKELKPVTFELIEYPLTPADTAIGGVDWVVLMRNIQLELESEKTRAIQADVKTLSFNQEGKKQEGIFKSNPVNGNLQWQNQTGKNDVWSLVKTGPIKASSNVKNSIFELRHNNAKIYGFRAVRKGMNTRGIIGARIFTNGWVLEYGEYVPVMIDSKPDHVLSNRITINGYQLNEKRHYNSCFAYARYNDKPFYFFQRGGKIGWHYNGKSHQGAWNAVLHNVEQGGPVTDINHLPDGPEFFTVRDNMYYYSKLLVLAQAVTTANE